jgi:hypothetical protein
MSKLVRGDRLPSDLRRQVLSRYVHRWTSDNRDRERVWRGVKGAPTIPLQSDDQWLREHAFWVTSKGTLDARRKHAEPAFMIEDEAKNTHATKKKHLDRDIDHALGKREKMYRVVAVRDDKKWRGVLFPGPLTHKEAETVMKKTTKYPWRRLVLEEI